MRNILMALLLFSGAVDAVGEEIQLPVGGLSLNANLERAGEVRRLDTEGKRWGGIDNPSPRR